MSRRKNEQPIKQEGPPASGVAGRFRWRAVLIALGLLLLVAIAYRPAITAQYVWDDADHLAQPGIPQTTTGLWLIWFKLAARPQYYPITWSSFWIEAKLWGLDPLGYHIVNIVLHWLNAVLVWRILKLLKLRAALVIAAVWALHPVNVESVAWVSERKNVLSGLFYLSAMLTYLRFATPGQSVLAPARLSRGGASTLCPGVGEPGWGLYGAALTLYVCAVLSKSVTASLPAALILILWWKGLMSRRHAVLLAPMFGFALLMAFITAGMERWNVGAVGPPWELSPVERCLIAGRALCFYAWKLVWPAELIFNYGRWTIDAKEIRQYAYPAMVLFVVATLWFQRNKLGRGPLVAVLLFCGTLFPALGFVNVYPHRFSFVADHFQYLACIALVALIIESVVIRLLSATPRGVAKRVGLFAPLVIVLAVLTYNHAKIYQNAFVIWHDTLAKNPESWIAMTSLADIHAGKGELDQAKAYYEQSLMTHADQIESHLGLASVLEKQGNVTQATAHYHAAQAVRPNDVRATYHLGRLANQRGDSGSAIQLFEQALAIDEKYERARLDLADLKLAGGRPDQAIEQYEKALQLNPYSIEARRKLAGVLFRGGFADAAIQQLSQAEAHGDHTAVTSNNLGVMLMQVRRTREAEEQFRKAVQAAPTFAEAHYNLGRAREALGDRHGAMESYKEALRLKPDLAGARDDLKRLSP